MGHQIQRSGATAVIRLEGDLVVDTTAPLYRRLRALARKRDVGEVVVDFSGAGRVDSAGVAAVSLGSRMMAAAGKAYDVRHLGEHHEAAFELLPPWQPPPRPTARPIGHLEAVGGRIASTLEHACELTDFLYDSGREALAVATRRRRLPRGAMINQAVAMGVDGLPIIGLLSFLIGMTLAFQGAVQLEQFGADIYVADLVGLAVVREFGPMMTAIILTGRTGAAIAAELGTMRVRDEVDALRAMGVSPLRFLVLPRLAALTGALPALTVIAMLIGISGGMVIASAVLDISPLSYWERVIMRVRLTDFAHGMAKSFVFAWIIGLVGCFMGLRAQGGPQSVGNATTRTVVVSIFLIIVVDALFATISALGKQA